MYDCTDDQEDYIPFVATWKYEKDPRYLVVNKLHFRIDIDDAGLERLGVRYHEGQFDEDETMFLHDSYDPQTILEWEFEEVLARLGHDIEQDGGTYEIETKDPLKTLREIEEKIAPFAELVPVDEDRGDIFAENEPHAMKNDEDFTDGRTACQY